MEKVACILVCKHADDRGSYRHEVDHTKLPLDDPFMALVAVQRLTDAQMNSCQPCTTSIVPLNASPNKVLVVCSLDTIVDASTCARRSPLNGC